MWIKKHWNDPITVGGLTKLNIWVFVISCIAALTEIVYLCFKWYNWADKIRYIMASIKNMIIVALKS